MNLVWPGLLALLLLVPLLVVAYVLALRRRKPSSLRYSSVSLVLAAAPPRRGWRRHLPFALFALAVALLLVAVARPTVTVAVPSNQATIILAIDVSRSMCASDIEPNRLIAAEAAAAAFIERQAPDAHVGIVAFSGFAQIVQAPTTDRKLLLDALSSLVTGRRTGIGHGILEAIDAINVIDPNVPRATTEERPGSAPVPAPPGTYAPAIIVLLTDGANNTGPEPIDAAQQAADRGIRVYPIGFGTEFGGAFSDVCPVQFVGSEPGGFGG
ncbi:MAG: VWA domain-containing protein, partial [Candidatus Limnocylindrales bacterium]